MSDEKYIMNFDTAEKEEIERQYLSVVSNYIFYYGKRAQKCKIEYYTLSIIKFTAVGIIPLLETLQNSSSMQWRVSIAALICILAETIMGLLRVRSKWPLYRDTYNILMSVQRKYLSQKDRSDCDFKIFVDQVEDIIRSEADSWKTIVKQKKVNDDPKHNESDSGIVDDSKF